MTCPYAKDIGGGLLRGCTAKPNKLGTGSGVTTYYPPCTEACYNGDYENCPLYKKAKAIKT